VAAPLRLGDEAVRLAVISKLGWIRRQQQGFEQQDRQSRREMVTGESHFFAGRRYRLKVIEQNGIPAVSVSNARTMLLRVRPGATQKDREAVLHRWYRHRLREQLPALLAKWEPKVGVKVRELRIKRMKTRWGTCNQVAKRIWLNLELAKKAPACLEYILVHEMVHFHYRYHDSLFKAEMDRLMPQWRSHRQTLNHAPLAHQEWRY
jgi:predicted metal-dependent hydrolase